MLQRMFSVVRACVLFPVSVPPSRSCPVAVLSLRSFLVVLCVPSLSLDSNFWSLPILLPCKLRARQRGISLRQEVYCKQPSLSTARIAR